MPSQVQLVRDLWRTYESGGLDAFFAMAGDDVVWQPFITGDRVFRGTAELRAFNAVPVNNAFHTVFMSGFGSNAKFTTPGVGANRIFIGTGQGHVVCFGTATVPPVSAPPFDFGTVTVNQPSTQS